jgi:hypothetical protein
MAMEVVSKKGVALGTIEGYILILSDKTGWTIQIGDSSPCGEITT